MSDGGREVTGWLKLEQNVRSVREGGRSSTGSLNPR